MLYSDEKTNLQISLLVYPNNFDTWFQLSYWYLLTIYIKIINERDTEKYVLFFKHL